MDLKKVLPVSISSRSKIHHINGYSGIKFLSYISSMDSVVILSADLIISKTIQFEQEVTGMSWNLSGDRVAIAVGFTVHIYNIDTDLNTVEKLYNLEHDFIVNCLTWAIDQKKLLVGGNMIVMWDLDFSLRQKQIHESKQIICDHCDVDDIQFSDDGRLFYTVAEGDQMPKIWFSTKKGFEFIYLPHPMPVIKCSWKPIVVKDKFSRNIILTFCKDGVIRIWVESNSTQQLRFSIFRCIEANPYMSVDWISLPLPQSKMSHIINDTDPFHNPIRNMKEISNMRESSDERLHHDWIIGIDPGKSCSSNGDIIIWQLSNLPFPKCRINRLVNLKKVIDANLENHNIISLSAIASMFTFSDDFYRPRTIHLYVSSQLGDIRKLTIDTTSNETSLVQTLTGHGSRIMRVKSHSNLLFLATLDVQKNLMIWRTNSANVSDTGAILTFYRRYNHLSENEILSMDWDYTDPIIYILLRNSEINVYHIENEITSTYSISTSLSLIKIQNIPNVFYSKNKQLLLDKNEDFLMGIDSLQNPAILLIEKSGGIVEKITSITEKKFDETITVITTSICCNINDTMRYTPQFCNFITGDESGFIRFWNLRKKSDQWEIHQKCAFKAQENPIHKIRAAHFGDIAVFDKDMISIWSLASNGKHFQLESEISLSLEKKVIEEHIGKSSVLLGKKKETLTSDNIFGQEGEIFLEWLTLEEGTNVFVAAKANFFTFFHRQRNSPMNDYQTNWVPVISNSTPFSHPVSNIHFLKNGSLLVNTNELSLFSKWINNGSAVLYDRMTQHKRLPSYHPKILCDFLLAGNFDRLLTVLDDLYNDIKSTDQKRIDFISEKSLLELCNFDVSTLSTFPPYVETEIPDSSSEDPFGTVGTDPFSTQTHDPFGDPSSSDIDPFGDPYDTPANDPFGDPSSDRDPFGGPSNDPFGDPVNSDPFGDPFSDDDEKNDAAVKSNYGFLDNDLSSESSSVEIKFTTSSSINTESSTTSVSDSSSDSSSDIDDDGTPVSSTTSTASNLITLEEEIYYGNSDHISPNQCRELAHLVTITTLPGVSPKEQIYFLAILDTLANILEEGIGLADTAAITFTLSVKLFRFLNNSGSGYRNGDLTMDWLDMAWAMQADGKQSLIEGILSNEPDWNSCKELGVALWCDNIPVLKKLVENFAKLDYMKTKDIESCMHWYMALKKKAPVIHFYGLQARDEKVKKIIEFLEHDFEEPRWKEAALKNGFRLMSIRNYTLAIGFFLLGGHVKNAVAVCIKNLGDFQLALLIACVYEENRSGPVFRDIIENTVLPMARLSKSNTLSSLCYWILGEYEKSIINLTSFTEETTTYSNTDIDSVRETMVFLKPNVFHYYKFLLEKRQIKNRKLEFPETEKNILRNLIFTYYESGCVQLSLEHHINYFQNQKSFKQDGYDQLFLLKCAIRYLAQQIQSMTNSKDSRIGSVDTDIKVVLYENISSISTYLNIDEKIIIDILIDYCSENNFILEQYYLYLYLDDIMSISDLLIKKSRELRDTCASFLTENNINFTRTQGERIENIARVLSHLGNPSFHSAEIPVEHLLEIIATGRFGAFITSWFLKDYVTLHELLKGTQIDQLSKSKITTWKHVENSHDKMKSKKDKYRTTDSSEDTVISVENQALLNEPEVIDYIVDFVHVLSLFKFMDVLETVLLMNGSKTPSEFPIYQMLQSYLNSLENSLRNIPKSILLKLSLRSDETFFTLYELLFLPIYGEKNVWSEMIETLLEDSIVIDYIKSLDVIDQTKNFYKLIKNEILNSDDEKLSSWERVELKFDIPIMIYKTKDLVRQFDFNPTDPNQIAIVTTEGIIELAINPPEQAYYSNEKMFHIKHVSSPKIGKSRKREKAITDDESGYYSPATEGIIRQNTVQNLTSHPTKPFYLSGNSLGEIDLWKFGVVDKVGMYLDKGPRIHSMKFNSAGSRFASCDDSGLVSIFSFDQYSENTKPVATVKAHDGGRSMDVLFLNNGSFFSASGTSSSNKGSIVLCDSLLSSSVIADFPIEQSGSVLAYSPRNQILFAGGKKGTILMIDIRQRKVMSEIDAHAQNCRALSMDSLEKYLISGGTEGDVKVWDFSKGEPSIIEEWVGIHHKQTFVRPMASKTFTTAVSTFGVTQVHFKDQYYYSCGSGSIIQRGWRYNL